MNDDQQKLLNVWKADMQLITWSHYEAASTFSHRNYSLGIPVVVLTALVGTSLFASLASTYSAPITIGTGLVSICATILSATQTFLAYSERAQMHREAGARFGALLKEIEQVIAIPPQDDTQLEAWCQSFRQRWDEIAIESPTAPKKIWKTTRTRVKNHGNA